VSRQTGDSRGPGATREDLLGQHARQRATSEIEARAIDTSGEAVPAPELPSLDAEVYCLEPDCTGSRNRRAALLRSLHGLGLDHALSDGGDVVWIDAQGHATTHTLTQVAPSERALDRVHVARAFTTHQHHTLVTLVARWLRGEPPGPFGPPDTDRPAVLVCPALDSLYVGGDLPDPDARALLSRAVALLVSIARTQDIPVLTSRAHDSSETGMVARATRPIRVSQTPFGPRFEAPGLDFETLVYPVAGGMVQTTFAFWRQVLGARHPDIGATAAADQSAPIPAEPATPDRAGGR
jgi:hypothetical protein